MNFADMGIIAVPVITVIAFLVAEAIKLAGLDSKWCPVICGAVGGALGVVAMSVMPDYPATDILTAIAVGIVSGLAATGVHQIYKQLAEPDNSRRTNGSRPAEPDPAADPDVLSVDDILDEFRD